MTHPEPVVVQDSGVPEVEQASAPIASVSKGDRLSWRGVQILVTRVSKTGAWADIDCKDGTERWSKRQALPFPADTIRVAS